VAGVAAVATWLNGVIRHDFRSEYSQDGRRHSAVHSHEARRNGMARDVIVGIFDSRNQAYDAAREIELEADIVDVKSGAQGG
jgi:hypothetical protein